MWSFVLLSVAFVAQSWAIPVLPLSVTGIEKLEELKTNDNLRTFIVQVQGTPDEKQEQKQRDYPWPYPPVFEPYLPAEAKQRLNQIYVDSSLSAEQREQQVNGVFDELPQQVIASLPLPAEYERLPADVYKRILYIHVAAGFSWAERQELTRTIVEALPEEQKQLMHTPRIGGPPPGFEFVLAPTVYKQLLFVHHNAKLGKEEKSEMITRIMRQVPQEQINRLPLPQGMDRLPTELQTRARSLVYDYSVPQPVRAQRVREFVEQLPEQLRPQLR